MNYIVFDLEWNQSASGKRNARKSLPFEVIEIGAVKLNHNMKAVDKFDELIKPIVYRDLNRITGNIVHISQNDLDHAKPLKEVMKGFRKFCGEDYVFCTWGNLDLLELQRNLAYFKLPELSSGPIRFLDVQKVFSLQTEGKKGQHTLEYAVDYFKIKKDIPFHRAYADAYYTAKVLKHIKKSFKRMYSFDTYKIPSCKEEEIRIDFKNYSKYISMGFENRHELMKDKDVSYNGCYLCRRKPELIIDWYTVNSKHYYSVSKCKRHGFIKGKVRVRKNDEGLAYGIKTMKQIKKNEVDEIIEKSKKKETSEEVEES